MKLIAGDAEATPIGKIADAVLKDAGLSESANIVARTTTAPEMITALSTGECDAAVVWKENAAKSEEVDKILGLNMGADDYVTKPFTPLELLARVNSQLRRYSRYLEKLKDGGSKEEEQHIYRIGGLELNEEKVELRVDGVPVKVTPMEYRILLLLMKHPGRVFSSDEIYERVWNEKAVNSDTIMVHVRNIREKIEINPKNPKYLKVVWGVGYKMEKQ
mgnify:CR=1 FL=1